MQLDGVAAGEEEQLSLQYATDGNYSLRFIPSRLGTYTVQVAYYGLAAGPGMNLVSRCSAQWHRVLLNMSLDPGEKKKKIGPSHSTKK